MPLRRRTLELEEIVEGGLCIGCGLCQSIAGSERVTMVETTQGCLRPIARETLDQRTVEKINQVCPGVRIDGAESHRVAAGTPTHRLWGPTARLVIGWASDPELRHVGASGGVLTALADYLLDSGEVDFILHVGPTQDQPMRSNRHVSVDRMQVLRAAGSRYGPAAPLIDFMQLLDDGRRFAFIGKPCDVNAVRSLARLDPRVDERMRYVLTLVCGGVPELTRSHEMLSKVGLAERDLRVFRYRGHGNPGAIHMETTAGEVRELTYHDMWPEEDETSLRLQSRCKICPDDLGDGADIVAADSWDGGVPTGEDEGFNVILVHTERGLKLYEAAVAAGALTVSRSIDFAEMDSFHPYHLNKKRAALPRLLGMRLAGLPTPRTSGLRLASLAARQSPRSFVRELYGAYRRARAGRLGEAPPVPERDAAET